MPSMINDTTLTTDLQAFVAYTPKKFRTVVRVWDGNNWISKPFEFTLTLNLDDIKSLVVKANRNKSKKSKDGPVEVRIAL